MSIPDSPDSNDQDRLTDSEEFASQRDAKTPSVAGEFWYFLKENKKWWLVPLLLMLGLYGAFLIATLYGGPAFIYTFF